MKENFSEKYADVLAGMNEEDSEYILRCIREPKIEIEVLSRRLSALYEMLLVSEEQLKKAEESFFERCKKIRALVIKYNDTLKNDGIWNKVEGAEVRKKLNTFYSLAAAIEKSGADDGMLPHIEDLTREDIEIGKMISLLRRAVILLGGDKAEKVQSLISKYGLCHSMTKEIIKRNTELFVAVQKNEAALGKYISSLVYSLDEENKGERMNLSKARKCAEVFLLNCITEK